MGQAKTEAMENEERIISALNEEGYERAVDWCPVDSGEFVFTHGPEIDTVSIIEELKGVTKNACLQEQLKKISYEEDLDATSDLELVLDGNGPWFRMDERSEEEFEHLYESSRKDRDKVAYTYDPIKKEKRPYVPEAK